MNHVCKVGLTTLLVLNGDSLVKTLFMVGLTTLVATNGDSSIGTLMLGFAFIIIFLAGPFKLFFLLPIGV
jgi:hypothetical protein